MAHYLPEVSNGKQAGLGWLMFLATSWLGSAWVTLKIWFVAVFDGMRRAPKLQAPSSKEAPNLKPQT